ncbi:MAG: chromosome segregation protein SMC [Methanobacteriota archaeon]|nr:MAG: chromosome segregation protein SMC [Euryarchaeota archaeon]
MHLKEIELDNFKSFARKTRLPLLEGYTAVTGPNGAGKSNISDAILFVLGPKSSRVIRAGKLTDLIFNGGKDKRAAKECKVSLYFDNSDRLIPIDTGVVKLTRLVRRSENADDYYSYYYVNDKKSSLGEFDGLLANARISADGYNFVQQGDITRIVEMTNLERRRILDDIAGITKFDEDIQAAEKERATAEQNMERLSIIVAEIKKQMKQLERDREGALKYKDLHDRLSTSKAGLAVKAKESVEREIHSYKEQVTSYAAETSKMEEKRAELTSALESVSQELTSVEDEISERGGEEAREVKEKIDNLRIEIARAKDASSNADEMVLSLKETRKAHAEDLRAVQEDLEAIELKLEPLRKDHDGKVKALESRRKELDGHRDVISKSDSEFSALQKESLKMGMEVGAKEEKAHALTLEQDRLAERLSRLKIDIANLEETRKTFEFELKDAEWSIKELGSEAKESSSGLRKSQKEYEAARERERKLISEAQVLEDAVKSLTREYNRMKAEAEAADMVKKGFSSATMSLLEARDKGLIKGIHGTVAELAHVDGEYETALNVAAGNRMQSIVVDTDQVAASCIEFLKKNKLGSATFLPLNKMLDGRPRGKAIMAAKNSLGLAIDLTEFDEKYRAAFWFVFGDTVVVKNLTEARKLMGGVRLVTLGGELVEASGAMVGGTLDRNLVKFGAPSKSKIDKKAAELRTGTEQTEKTNAELTELRLKMAELEEAIRESNAKAGGDSVRKSSLGAKKKEFQQRLASVDAEMEAKNGDLSECLDLVEKAKQDIDLLRTQIEAAKQSKAEIDRKLVEATPDELSQKLKELEKDILESSNEVATLNSEIQTLAKQAELVSARKLEIEEAIATVDGSVKEQKNRRKEGVERQGGLETELKALQSMERSMGDKLNTLRNKRDSLYKKKTDTEAAMEKADTKIQTNGDFVLSIQSKLSETEERLKEAEAAASQYASVDLPEPLPPIGELRKTVAECERHMESLGAVNLRAIDEYDERKSRFDEIKAETGQLSKQRSNLIKLVDELNSKKKQGFRKIFVAIDENFSKIFSELSGGGEAELLLENEEDPLSGGLIIKARPKDKKFVRMEALSGGEKSLTALSFIFAIQAYEPSPFYLLDEVDMFLDGVNAENVSRAVRRSSRNAQFIQISLRKVTLKEADHIIGVTMQREGVSDLIMRPNLSDIADAPPDTGGLTEGRQEAAGT